MLLYLASDIQNTKRQVIVKLSSDNKNVRAETDILKKLSSTQCKHLFPQVYTGGEFMINNPFDMQSLAYGSPTPSLANNTESTLYSYILQQSYDCDLQHHLV